MGQENQEERWEKGKGLSRVKSCFLRFTELPGRCVKERKRLVYCQIILMLEIILIILYVILYVSISITVVFIDRQL